MKTKTIRSGYLRRARNDIKTKRTKNGFCLTWLPLCAQLGCAVCISPSRHREYRIIYTHHSQTYYYFQSIKTSHKNIFIYFQRDISDVLINIIQSRKCRKMWNVITHALEFYVIIQKNPFTYFYSKKTNNNYNISQNSCY